jgi:uncharacterized protein YndB with AHSA1/START domain
MNKVANAAVTEDGGFVLEMRRTFQAERTRVFDAFIKPEALAAWWGPAGVTAPRVELDLTPGGAFEIDMHHDKGAIHYLSGVYEEITPPERLVFSWAWGQGEDRGPSTHVILDFHEVAGGTEIVLTHSGFANEDARGQHGEGWGGCFDGLAAYL